MGQDGNRNSFPASFFEIDDFDSHWEAGRDGERPQSSRRDAELNSAVKASSAPPPPTAAALELGSLPPLDLDLDLDDPPSGEFAVDRPRVSEPELPLIHGANVPVTSTAPTERPPRRAVSTAPTERPALLPEPPPEPVLRRPVPRLALSLDEQPTGEPPPTVRPGLRRSLDSAPDFAEPSPATDDETEDSSRPTFPDDPLLNEVRDRYATGDYSGALLMAEAILQGDGDHSLARRYADHCRHVLEQMATSRLGSLARVPRVSVEGDRLRWLSLDHRGGFLLSLIDGQSSLEELLDISGMPRFEALKILCDLLDQDVIVLSRAER